MSARCPFAEVVIVGGAGAVGSLLRATFQKSGGTSIRLIDRRVALESAGCRQIESDIRAPSDHALSCIRSADLVVLAVPEDIAIQAVPALISSMKPSSLLVDTLSVKIPFAETLSQLPRPGVELLGINPMFAPGLGFAGRSVAAIPYSSFEKARAFLDLLRGEGAEVVELDAEAHDRACAALQVATHAAVLSFGMALRAIDYDMAAVERIIPPPHRTMLALLARILSADPEVYRDVQTANPFAGEMRLRLREAQHRLDQIIATGSTADFAELLEDLRHIFDGSEIDHAALCARLFQVPER